MKTGNKIEPCSAVENTRFINEFFFKKNEATESLMLGLLTEGMPVPNRSMPVGYGTLLMRSLL